jgi:hypothetical protein
MQGILILPEYALCGLLALPWKDDAVVKPTRPVHGWLSSRYYNYSAQCTTTGNPATPPNTLLAFLERELGGDSATVVLLGVPDWRVFLEKFN